MKEKFERSTSTVRVWVRIDPTADEMMRLAGLYVLYAVLDKCGGFPKKVGTTKRKMAAGALRSFIFDGRDRGRVLRALNAYEAVFASTVRERVAAFA